MIGIVNEIVAVVAPAVDITLVATTGLLEAVKKENEMHTNCISCNLQLTIVNPRGHVNLHVPLIWVQDEIIEIGMKLSPKATF